VSVNDKRILFCVTGSIAAYRVCDLIGELRKRGARLTCAMTRSACEFITPLTLRSLSGGKVYTDLFTAFEGVLHTTLADESDLILVMPASANVLARLAQGIADDLVTCTILAARKKILIVPAMNDNMYRHPLTQEHVKKLGEIGYEFVDPVQGPLVCGRDDIGHIASSEVILGRIESLLKDR
jgi:phosphopantothenoylcysteine decarboxylase/phosphopantothenate--cysteine ligase